MEQQLKCGRFKNVAGSFGKKYGKSVVRGVGKVAGGATLGTLGLAAGIATGDMGNAFAGLAGGITAGKNLGGRAVDGIANMPKKVTRLKNNITDTYREGAYGKAEAERMRFDEELKKSEGYKNLMNKYPGSENKVQEFLNNGITDTGKMDKAMDGEYSIEESIAYMKLAEAKDCPDEVLYDTEKFKTYLDAHNIDSSRADEIRRGIVKFK